MSQNAHPFFDMTTTVQENSEVNREGQGVPNRVNFPYHNFTAAQPTETHTATHTQWHGYLDTLTGHWPI